MGQADDGLPGAADPAHIDAQCVRAIRLRDRCAPIRNDQQVCAADPLDPDHLLRIQSVGTSYFSCDSDLHRAARTTGQQHQQADHAADGQQKQHQEQICPTSFLLFHPLRPPHAVQAAPFTGRPLNLLCHSAFSGQGFGMRMLPTGQSLAHLPQPTHLV